MPRPALRLRLALLTALLAAGGRAAADEPAPAPGPAPAPSAAPATAPAAGDAERRAAVLRIVDGLRADAARVRGLPWKREVPVEVITREQLRANLVEMTREDLKPDEYDRDVRAARRLGLLREDEDPLEIEMRFLGEGILGYFNQKTKRIYVIDGLTGDAQRPTILHELVHSLEDQYVDLETSTRALEKDPDRLFAFRCLVEGSAERARVTYERENPAVARLSAKEQSSARAVDGMRRILATTPALLLLPTILPYEAGLALIDRAVGGDYANGMTRLYADLPVSEEQLLHPDRYLGSARDLPRRIAWPADLATALGEGWKAHEASPVGELDYALWMDRWLGATEGRVDLRLRSQGRFCTRPARLAARGWDGMRLQIFDQGGRTTGYALASAWDTPEDAREAAEALERALLRQYGDAYRAGGWTEGEGGVRTLDFEGPYGRGRIEVRGDEVRVADGFPAPALDALWRRLAAVRIERDPADAWTPASDPDPLAGAAWRSEDAGAGWKPPSDWTLETQPDGTGVATHGETRAFLWVRPGGIEENRDRLLTGLRSRYPTGRLDPEGAQTAVGPMPAQRYRVDDPAGAEAARNRELYVVPSDGALLVVEVESPRATWSAAHPAIDALLRGFAFRE